MDKEIHCWNNPSPQVACQQYKHIYPKVMGSRISLPGMWILAAVTVDGGPPGMLISVPVASMAYILIKEATQKREKQQSIQQKESSK